MLTKFYPFGSGEAFIENEIDIVSKKFDKVIIVACDINKEIVECRKLPQNVETIRINSESKFKSVPGIIKNFISPNKELKEEIKYCVNIGQKLFACYFETKSEMIYKTLKEKLNIEELKCENITIYSYWLFATARVGIYLAEDLKKAVKYTFTRAHRYDLYADRNALNYLPMRNLLLSYYDVIGPCSDNGTKYLVNLFPQHKEKIKTAFLGTFDYGLNKTNEDGVFRILSCSRIEKVKRLERIIDALYLLDNKGYQIEWTHIGGGSLEEKIKSMANIKLKNIRCIFTGNMNNSDVIGFYKENSVNLFVNVSSSEGLPVSIMEAISFGIPVIATDVGGTNEIVFDGKNGFLIPSDFCSKEMADKIELFLLNKIDIEGMRSMNRKIWEENFQAEKNYRKIFDNMEQEKS